MQQDFIETKDLDSYIPGYDEFCEVEEEMEYSKEDYYVDSLVEERILERLEKESD
jgi:hypothetical protein